MVEGGRGGNEVNKIGWYSMRIVCKISGCQWDVLTSYLVHGTLHPGLHASVMAGYWQTGSSSPAGYKRQHKGDKKVQCMIG